MDYGETGENFGLFRCPREPAHGCSLDKDFGPGLLAAGANDRFVVMKMQSRPGVTEPAYFYFTKTPQETGGWGSDPEKLIGPMGSAKFDKRRVALGLPKADVTLTE